MNKRRMMVRVTPEILGELCKSTGNDCMIIAIDGVPKDAELVAVNYSYMEGCFFASFTHDSFEEVEVGMCAPEKIITHTRYTV